MLQDKKATGGHRDNPTQNAKKPRLSHKSRMFGSYVQLQAHDHCMDKHSIHTLLKLTNGATSVHIKKVLVQCYFKHSV